MDPRAQGRFGCRASARRQVWPGARGLWACVSVCGSGGCSHTFLVGSWELTDLSSLTSDQTHAPCSGSMES